jgi:hypothetical protein
MDPESKELQLQKIGPRGFLRWTFQERAQFYNEKLSWDTHSFAKICVFGSFFK